MAISGFVPAGAGKKCGICHLCERVQAAERDVRIGCWPKPQFSVGNEEPAATADLMGSGEEVNLQKAVHCAFKTFRHQRY